VPAIAPPAPLSICASGRRVLTQTLGWIDGARNSAPHRSSAGRPARSEKAEVRAGGCLATEPLPERRRELRTACAGRARHGERHAASAMHASAPGAQELPASRLPRKTAPRVVSRAGRLRARRGRLRRRVRSGALHRRQTTFGRRTRHSGSARRRSAVRPRGAGSRRPSACAAAQPLSRASSAQRSLGGCLVGRARRACARAGRIGLCLGRDRNTLARSKAEAERTARAPTAVACSLRTKSRPSRRRCAYAPR